MDKVIAVVGPTASGKSDLAVEIARAIGGEVVSADSRQVYAGLDIGSGKITKKEMRGVPHHMLSIMSPSRTCTVSLYQKKARGIVSHILKSGGIPVVCGGTGQYVDALLYDTRFPAVKPDMTLRKKLERNDTETLFKLLRKKDPSRAKNIDPHNRRRLIRALEIADSMGTSPPPNPSPHPLYQTLFIGINPHREILYGRIRRRLTKRIREGMLEEVRNLHERGVSWKRLEDFGLEYRYASLFLRGKITKKEFTEQLFSEIKKYSKRQMTWFKRNTDIHWIERADMRLVAPFLRKFF